MCGCSGKCGSGRPASAPIPPGTCTPASSKRRPSRSGTRSSSPRRTTRSQPSRPPPAGNSGATTRTPTRPVSRPTGWGSCIAASRRGVTAGSAGSSSTAAGASSRSMPRPASRCRRWAGTAKWVSTPTRPPYRGAPPGDVQAFDAPPGARVWRWSPIPQAGEFGNATWGDSAWARVGHTNVWAPFTVDTARGLVFLPVSTPGNDYYGGARKGDNLFAESVVCLDARTGTRVWHFQTVHHGLWDYDLPAPPLLATIDRDGHPQDLVAVPTKTGFLFVFDRVSGQPVWPVEERRVPPSDVPGERASPTQPVPTWPRPFSRQGVTEADLVDFTPELKAMALEAVRGYRLGPLFTPPSLEGTVALPGVIGGSGWGGGAFDPVTGLFYVKANNSPALLKLGRPTHSATNDADYSLQFSASLGLSASAGDVAEPEVGGTVPITRPPYGTLTSIALATGEQRWQVTVGDWPRIRNHPLFKGVGLPPVGVVGSPGPIVTAGGLVFVSGGGATLEAFDGTTGQVLWSADLRGFGYAVPMTYRTRDGRQFVVIASGGDGADGVLQAYALP